MHFIMNVLFGGKPWQASSGWLLTCLASALACASGVAHAASAQPGPYAAADAGWSAQQTLTGERQNVSASSIAAGYALSSGLSVELSQSDLGRSASPFGRGRAQWQFQATSLALVPHWSVSDSLSFFGKVGVASTQIDASYLVRNIPVASKRLQGTSALAGVGLEYDLAPRWSTRIGVDVYGKFAGESDPLGYAYLGMVHRFQ